MDAGRRIAREEQVRRQAAAEKRYRGHRIKRGLEELRDLDAAPAARQPLQRARVEENDLRESEGNGPRPPSPPAAAAAAAPHAEAALESVFGAGWSSWRSVKERLFSPAASTAEKAEALEEMRLWQVRARRHRVVPPYVVATELLMRCVLRDEVAGLCAAPAAAGSAPSPVLSSSLAAVLLSPGDVVAAYGSAIARTVHVMTGSFSQEAATTYRRRARLIGFPEEAVEVRQRVAHGADLPSLSEMRWVCGLVLQHLFHSYWTEQERQIRIMEEDAAEATRGTGTAVAGPAKRAPKRKARAPPPSTSVEEMTALLAALSSSDDDESRGDEDGTAAEGASKGEKTSAEERKAVAAAGVAVNGGWMIS